MVSVSESFYFFYGGMASQWAESYFTVDSVTYNCAEQYMMAEKARLFGDHEALDKIMASSDPRTQKALGRQVKNFDKDTWEKEAKLIVYRGNFAKFTQNPHMLEWLLTTVGKTLVEASPWDNIWGIGLDGNDPRALSRDTWLGTNWLGEIITKVRDDIITMRGINSYETSIKQKLEQISKSRV